MKEWFMAWFLSEWDKFHEVFEEQAYYSESWGPEYHGLMEIKTWFLTWHTHSELITWDIKRCYHFDHVSVVEWYFCCRDDQRKHDFDGCSLIEWSENNKIVSLKEFCSALPKYRP